MRGLPNNFDWLPVFALDRVTDFVIVTDADLKSTDGPCIVYVNRSLTEATGYNQAELMGRSPRIFQGEKTDKATLARIKQALIAGQPVQAEVLNYTKDGRPYWTEINIAPIIGASGAPELFLSVQRDITEKRLLSEAHEQDQHSFAAGEKIGKLGMWAYDIAEDRMRWSEGARAIFDADREQLPRSIPEWITFFCPHDRPALTECLDRCIAAGTAFEREFSGVTKSGETRCLAIRGEARLDDEGHILSVVGAIHDITSQERLASALTRALAQSSRTERHFASARLAGKIGIFDYSVSEDLQYWSDELLKMTGLEGYAFPAPSEAFISGIDKADRPLFDALFGRAISHGEDYSLTLRFQRPDGRKMHMHIIAEVHDEADGRRIVGIARDVTKEVQASEQLKLQEERFRIIADSVSDVLWDYHIDQDKFWVSPDWPRKLGLIAGAENFVPARWVDYVLPEFRAHTWTSLLEALRSSAGTWRCEFGVADVAGTRTLVEINATILRNDDGRAFRMLGNLRNITKEKLEQEGITRSRALEAVGKMTGGVAHDFNNLLMIIQGNAELLAMSALEEEDRESVQLITKASEAAANLTAKLLSFSGQTTLINASLDTRELLGELLPLLKSGLTSAIEVKVQIAPDVRNVEVDGCALEQAIINLAVNARDAMPDGGTITIAARNHVVDSEFVGATNELVEGDYVCISVSDNGEGMSPDVIAKACEPFFTTKDVGKGTGLGLSSAYGFARQSGGALQIESELGRGTKVSLYLPVSKENNVSRRPMPPEPIVPPPTSQSVLVVEDQADVRRHVEKLLRRAGFKVESAENAHAALAILQSGETFDFLFTDVIMPGGMNGVQLADAVAEIAPHMKILFTSGFPSSAFEEVGVRAWENFDLLQKPYGSGDLINAIRALT